MRILVDENIPRITVDALRAFGHDVKDVRGTSGQGVPDSDLYTLAVAESRAIVTTDKGFTGYRREPHHGILIVRLRQPERQEDSRRRYARGRSDSRTRNGRICSWWFATR